MNEAQAWSTVAVAFAICIGACVIAYNLVCFHEHRVAVEAGLEQRVVVNGTNTRIVWAYPAATGAVQVER